ncbi:hypothetical protein [Rheinheimera texasensis]|jgi:hypothetical protein|uniref:hypothetical protein n=1 Tax=Rheinheimera texasensis TaxID=306205 RepID=UPI0005672144|nr:hypothetical protein [Rheinheimera texasensis]
MSAETLKFPPSLTIYEVQDYAGRWQVIAQHQPEQLNLDLSELQELDGAGFQLLLSLLKSLPIPSLAIQAGPESHLIAAWLADQLIEQGYRVGGLQYAEHE